MPSPVRTCIHVYTNGLRCGSPALRKSVRCFHHHGHRRRLKRSAIYQSVDTAKGRAKALQMVIDGLMTNRVEPEAARSMLYAISLGMKQSNQPSPPTDKSKGLNIFRESPIE